MQGNLTPFRCPNSGRWLTSKRHHSSPQLWATTYIQGLHVIWESRSRISRMLLRRLAFDKLEEIPKLPSAPTSNGDDGPEDGRRCFHILIRISGGSLPKSPISCESILECVLICGIRVVYGVKYRCKWWYVNGIWMSRYMDNVGSVSRVCRCWVLHSRGFRWIL